MIRFVTLVIKTQGSGLLVSWFLGVWFLGFLGSTCYGFLLFGFLVSNFQGFTETPFHLLIHWSHIQDFQEFIGGIRRRIFRKMLKLFKISVDQNNCDL